MADKTAPLVFLLCVLLLSTSSALHSAITTDNRADIATQSFLSKFWSESDNYLKDKWHTNSNDQKEELTAYWTYAQGFDVILDAAERNFTQFGNWISKFYNGQKQRGWDRPFFDDLNWMALCLLRSFSLTKEPAYLEQSVDLYNKIADALDVTCCGPTPGGVWWDASHSQKATASNAGPVILAAKLYQVTKEVKYLAFAKSVYQYWWSNMVNPSTYQVCDHLSPKPHEPSSAVPEYTWWKFTYNEGLMIGASVELYLVTGDQLYLTNAHKVAHFMVTQETTSNAQYSSILTDGNEQQCQGDCHEFKGIGIRYLAALHRVSPQPEYATLLKNSFESLWNIAREKNMNVFGVDWSQPFQNKGSEISQAQTNAAVMSLNVITNVFKRRVNQ